MNGETRLESSSRIGEAGPAWGRGEYWSEKAVCLQLLRRLDEAKAAHDRAVEEAGRSASSWVNRGAFRHDALKDPVGALEDLSRALALEPTHVVGLRNRGTVLATLRRHEEAVASFDEALRLGGADPRTMAQRARSLSALGSHEAAARAWLAVWELDPSRPDPVNQAAQAWIEAKRWDEAWAALEHVLRLRPGNREARHDQGFILAEKGEVRGRLAALTAVHLALAFAIAVGYGATDEWHQAFVPGRSSDGLDLAADAVGALLGVIACGIIGRFMRRCDGVAVQ